MHRGSTIYHKLSIVLFRGRWCWWTPNLPRRVECSFVLFFELGDAFCHFRNSAGASFLLQGFLSRSVLKFRGIRTALMKISTLKSHLAMDPLIHEFSCAAMYLLSIARCASVPKILCPSVQSNWISSSLCETISKGTTSHKERTPRASTETRDDGCGTVCTVTTTCVWEHGWTMRGTDRKFIKRFIMTLRGNVGLAAHHSREMRILNRVLTWRSSEARRAGRITCEEDPRHENLLLRDYGVEFGKSRGEDSTLGHARVLGKEPAFRSLLAS